MINKKQQTFLEQDSCQAILAIRKKEYDDLITEIQSSDTEDKDALIDSITNEFNTCDTFQLVDSIMDEILDSFGS